MITLLVTVILVLVIFSLLWWAVSFLPVPANIKNVVYVLLIIILVIYLVSLLPHGGILR